MVGSVALAGRLRVLVVPGVLHGQFAGIVGGVEVGVVAEVLQAQRGVWARGQVVALAGATLVAFW